VSRVTGWTRPAWVEVDLGAIEANVAYIGEAVSPAGLCAVVKADAYGHGAVRVARAAIAGGADRLAVALAEEGHELRQAGIDVPVIVLSEPAVEAMRLVVEDKLVPTIYTKKGLAALLDALRAREGVDLAVGDEPFPVHLKVDTGMHRVGASPGDVAGLARAVAADPAVVLEGLYTHLAVADDPAGPYTQEQLACFDRVVAELAATGARPPLLHAANSAGALLHSRSRYGMVRPGIAIYGIAPAASLQGHPAVSPLRPALAFKAEVTYLKEVAGGEGISYGLHYRVPSPSVIATVPVGYADGVARRLFEVGGEVLIAGRRRPIAGAVTMDQILVDCGPGAEVSVGDEVVLIGRQGDEEVTAWEWAERLGTIAYEVTCALSPRLPRVYI
jgi:alanine racemase